MTFPRASISTLNHTKAERARNLGLYWPSQAQICWGRFVAMSPRSHDAAINSDDLSGHPVSIFRNQKRNYVRDVAWLPEPTKRRDRRRRITRKLRNHRSVGWTRRNGIHGNVAFSEFFGKNFDELFDRCFACGVKCHARPPLQYHVA